MDHARRKAIDSITESLRRVTHGSAFAAKAMQALIVYWKPPADGDQMLHFETLLAFISFYESHNYTGKKMEDLYRSVNGSLKLTNEKMEAFVMHTSVLMKKAYRAADTIAIMEEIFEKRRFDKYCVAAQEVLNDKERLVEMQLELFRMLREYNSFKSNHSDVRLRAGFLAYVMLHEEGIIKVLLIPTMMDYIKSGRWEATDEWRKQETRKRGEVRFLIETMDELDVARWADKGRIK
jgi:hypothetical protein